MALKEIDLKKYYEVDDKVTTEQFSSILQDMKEETKGFPHRSSCVSYALSTVYKLRDHQISYFIRDYGEMIADEIGNYYDEIRIFGLTMNLESLLIVCSENMNYYYTPLDIIANFAIENNIADEKEIIEEALDLYEIRFNINKEIAKQTLFKIYSKKGAVMK